MVLLDLLHQLSVEHGWHLAVAHFNHRLRGRASDADERLVKMTTARLGLRCFAARADVRAFSRRKKLSLEMAARQLRHDFLARTARRLKIKNIALAHHADDQVEHFFLRLFRGASGRGLAGMRWLTASPGDPRITLVRPLLDQSKQTLQRYAKGQGIVFREDTSNRHYDFLRNRIRRELLPLLRREYQPAIAKTVLRVMDLLAAESDFVRRAVKELLQRKRRPAFANLPVAIQRQWLEMSLLKLGVAPQFDLIEQLRRFPNQPVTVSPTLTLERDATGNLRRRAPVLTQFNSQKRQLELNKRGGATFGGLKISWRTVSGQVARRSLSRRHPSGECFDATKVGRRIVLRHWRPGDRFQPIGMARPVKLQDWFVNQRVPRARRHELIVAEAASGLLFWVEGMRISELFKLDKHSRQGLKWEWSRQ